MGSLLVLLFLVAKKTIILTEQKRSNQILGAKIRLKTWKTN
jgi:hypothetical protein